MKKVLVFLLGLMFIATGALAADVTLSWDASVGATSYKIQMSTDQGVTWAAERPVPTGTTFTWTAAPDTGLLLFRAVAVNGAGQAIRTDAGVWFNGSWKVPAPPAKFGAQ